MYQTNHIARVTKVSNIIGLLYVFRLHKLYKNAFLHIIQILMVCPQFTNVTYEIPIDLTLEQFFKTCLFSLSYSFLADQYFAT